MQPTEYLGYIAIAAAAILWYGYSNRAALLGILAPGKPSDPAVPLGWHEEWVTTLMRFSDEAKGTQDSDKCVPLARELIWRLLGGEPNNVLRTDIAIKTPEKAVKTNATK